MSASGVVAIVGAVGTPIVAIAGYIAAEIRARRTAAEGRATAADTHEHERELALGAQTHEAQLRRGERAYEDRRAAYRLLLRWALVGIQRVQLTEPILTYEGMPEPPDPPSEEEWRELQVEIGAFGSAEVGDAMEVLMSKMRGFNASMLTVRLLRQQNAQGRPDMAEAMEQMQQLREQAADAYDELKRRIRDELAAL